MFGRDILVYKVQELISVLDDYASRHTGVKIEVRCHDGGLLIMLLDGKNEEQVLGFNFEQEELFMYEEMVFKIMQLIFEGRPMLQGKEITNVFTNPNLKMIIGDEWLIKDIQEWMETGEINKMVPKMVIKNKRKLVRHMSMLIAIAKEALND